jgi:hypothetical protein
VYIYYSITTISTLLIIPYRPTVQLLGAIDLTQAYVTVQDVRVRKSAFQITTSVRSWWFAAATDQERDEWIKAVKYAFTTFSLISSQHFTVPTIGKLGLSSFLNFIFLPMNGTGWWTLPFLRAPSSKKLGARLDNLPLPPRTRHFFFRAFLSSSPQIAYIFS